MISRDIRSIIRKVTYYIRTQKSTTKTSMYTIAQKWLLKMLLIVFLSLSCIYVYSLENIIVKNTPDIKYILMWTPKDWYPFYNWKTGRETFIERRCPHSNCFVTNRRDFFGEDLTKFDAIAFNVRNLNITSDTFFKPEIRAAHQKYIFVNTESSDYFPVCSSVYDGFFNWTATYKLNSDIVYSYIEIKNKYGDEVGPKVGMTWYDRMEKDSEMMHFNKSKAVAWLVSNCATRNKREIYAKMLKIALKKHKLTLDIYGRCGLKCDKCSELLHNYYFYLAFENSFAEDYVTEKLLTPLQNNNVPIVYGGADYSRFLPPRSYLDARRHSPEELAAIIARIIDTPAEYDRFFDWKRHYSYQEPDNVCRLCAALNNPILLKYKVYKDIRGWWHPNYKKRCQKFHPS